MAKPKILIYCNVYDTVVGQGIPYMEFFSMFGDVIIISTEMNLNYWVKEGDILALPGGQDLLSSRYRTPPGWHTKNVNSHYEYLDEYLLKPWLETGKPIVGICRGMQALNVALGGTLHRHVDGHVQEDRKERWETPDVMFTNIKGHWIHNINSYHHQAVKDVAPGFDVIGWSEYDMYDRSSEYSGNFKGTPYYRPGANSKNKTLTIGELCPMVPEMMIHRTMPYVAFQYHPEELKDPLAILYINKVLNSYTTNKSQQYASSSPVTEEVKKKVAITE